MVEYENFNRAVDILGAVLGRPLRPAAEPGVARGSSDVIRQGGGSRWRWEEKKSGTCGSGNTAHRAFARLARDGLSTSGCPDGEKGLGSAASTPRSEYDRYSVEAKGPIFFGVVEPLFLVATLCDGCWYLAASERASEDRVPAA